MTKPTGPLKPGESQGYQKTPFKEESNIDESAFPSVPTDAEPADTKGMTPYDQLPQNRFAQFQGTLTVTQDQYQQLQLKPNEYQQLQLKSKQSPEITLQLVKKPPSEISRKDREKNAHSVQTVLQALSKEELNMLINAINPQNKTDPNKAKKANMNPENISVKYDAKNKKYVITDGTQGIKLDSKQMVLTLKLAQHYLQPAKEMTRQPAMTLSGGPRKLPPPPPPMPEHLKAIKSVAPDPSTLPPPPPIMPRKK
ncbi:MAG: hypothetical protein JSR17_12060 [Proteobacteria bacterium]|nr:hypothetical protein [Pseudomonadota bacterium]